jgi:arsenate reductase
MSKISKFIDACFAACLCPVLALLLGCAPTSQVEPDASPPTTAEAATPTTTLATEPQAEENTVTLHPQLHAYVETVLPTLVTIPDDRREVLDQIATFVRERGAAGQPIRLVFICTHNSRRSHMTQIWAATAAAWYGIEGVETYSGGTEATAFNPRAVAAMRGAGFQIGEVPADAVNPHYAVSFAVDGAALDVFSKTYDAAGNPSSDFVAIMTCSQADQACPFVRGSALRVSLPYEDPKVADGTPEEATRYDERARQIAGEMFYLFSKVEG